MTPAQEEIVKTKAAIGIEGERVIDLRHLVSQEFRVPNDILVLGQHVVSHYFEVRKKMIIDHNTEVERQVEEETELIRALTLGQSSVMCEECGEEISWGWIREHRRGGEGRGRCENSRLNYE